MKKKIYIGEEITTPNLNEFCSKFKVLFVHPDFIKFQKFKIWNFACNRLGEFTEDVGDTEQKYPEFVRICFNDIHCCSYFPKKELETLLNCQFINEKRPEETYKESFNKMMGDPLNNSIFKIEEPMKKLKTRDEIIKSIENNFGIFGKKISLSDSSTIRLVVEALEKEGIIQVAKEEVLEINYDSYFEDPEVQINFSLETDWLGFSDALRKFARLSWYFNKQANGDKNWVPDWDDTDQTKYSFYYSHAQKKICDAHEYYSQEKPNFFYFKTPEAKEKTLAEMTKEELKLLGLEASDE